MDRCLAAMAAASAAKISRVWVLLATASPWSISVGRWLRSSAGRSASDRSRREIQADVDGCNVEPRQDEKFAGAGGGDIPEPDAFAIELGLLRVARGVVARRLDAEDRAIEGLRLRDR